MTTRTDPLRTLYREVFGVAKTELSEDRLTVEDLFDRRPPSQDRFQEEIFEYTVAEVERLFADGALSALEAAEMLGLSLGEFVEQFVLDEEWLSALGVVDQHEKEELIAAVTKVLGREANGLSVDEFVEEHILDDDFFSLPEVRGRGTRQEIIRQALEGLPTDFLGILLRRELSVNTSLHEFVQTFVLTEAWFLRLGINDPGVRRTLIDKASSALAGLSEYIFNNLWFTAFAMKDREISDNFVEKLGEEIASREIESVTKRLAMWDHRTVLLSPNEKNAATLLGFYAQWIDFDSSYLPRVEELLLQFRRLPRNNRSLEAAHFETAEGLVGLHNERYDEAIMYFKRAMQLADEHAHRDLSAVNRYYLARCLWKKGNYKEARKFTRAARELDDPLTRQKRIAAIKMVEGWLCFLDGNMTEARHLLGEAEAELKETEPINHGNILSFYGRLYLKEERYDRALKYFWKAILAYQRGDPKHWNIARTHANIASTYYLRAGQVLATGGSRRKLLRLRVKAFEHLDAAEHIYKGDPNKKHHRGLGKVHHLRALLYTAADELDRARVEAEKAFSLGLAKDDHILMGRAKRVLWKAVPDPFKSLALSQEVLLHAERTDNRTLRARAYINMGRNLLKISDFEQAKKYLEDAHKCLTREERERPYWREAFRKAIDGCTTLSVG